MTDHRVTALRLWARGWLLARPAADPSAPRPDTGATDDGGVVAVARIPVPPPVSVPTAGPPAHRSHAAGSPVPRSFARPSALPHPPETPR